MTSPVLYRFLSDRESAVAHLEGKFRFGSFGHFREIEDDKRRDWLEGKASYRLDGGYFVQVANDDHPTQPIYILSTTQRDVCPGFGDCRITIPDPETLRIRIKEALPANARVFLEKVKYGKPETLPSELTGAERLDRAWSQKPQQYCDEEEWRFIVVLAPDMRISNPQLHLNLRDCGDIIQGPDWVEEIAGNEYLDGLKRPHQLFIPDVRSSNMTMVDGTNLDRLHRWMDNAELKGSAPPKVVAVYDIARNLFVYSWYQYRFTMPAAQQVVSAIEFALRERFRAEGISIKNRYGKDKSLRPLFSDAVDRGWITDRGFGEWMPESLSECDIEHNRYSNSLKECLPDIRNWFSHGTSSFMDQGHMYDVIARSGVIIDQLFPPTS